MASGDQPKAVWLHGDETISQDCFCGYWLYLWHTQTNTDTQKCINTYLVSQIETKALPFVVIYHNNIKHWTMWRALGPNAVVSQPAKIRLWLISYCLLVVEVAPSSAYPRITAIKGSHWSHVLWEWGGTEQSVDNAACLYICLIFENSHKTCSCSQYSVKKW